MVTASGELVTLSCTDKNFDGAIVALGALGVVTKVTLDVVPTYQVQQDVYDNLPFAHFASHLDEMAASAYSLSFFTHWHSDTFDQVWRKRKTSKSNDADLEWFGGNTCRRSASPASGNACGKLHGSRGRFWPMARTPAAFSE